MLVSAHKHIHIHTTAYIGEEEDSVKEVGIIAGVSLAVVVLIVVVVLMIILYFRRY